STAGGGLGFFSFLDPFSLAFRSRPSRRSPSRPRFGSAPYFLLLSADPFLPVLPSSLASASASRRVFLTASLLPPPLPSEADVERLQKVEELKDAVFPQITTVVDCMYTRRFVSHPSHPDLSVSALIPIDRGSALLRANAAGNVRPGAACYRLLPRHGQSVSWLLSPREDNEEEAPEVQLGIGGAVGARGHAQAEEAKVTTDSRLPLFPVPDLLLQPLLPSLLLLFSLGFSSLSSLPLLAPPQPSAVRLAMAQLRALQAITREDDREETERRSQGEDTGDRCGEAARSGVDRRRRKRNGPVLWTLTEPLGRMMGEITMKPQIVRLLYVSSQETASCSVECLTLAALLSLPSPFLSPEAVAALSPASSSLSAASAALRRAKQRLRLVKQILGVVGGDLLTRYNAFQQWQLHRESLGNWAKNHCLNEDVLVKVPAVVAYLRRCMQTFNLPLVSCGGDGLQVQKAICASFFLNCAFREENGLYSLLTPANAASHGLLVSSMDGDLSDPPSLPRLALHPSSVLANAPPPWLVFVSAQRKRDADGNAVFLMQDVTAIDPEWLPEVAGHHFCSLREA
ncbi:putative helicase associated domain protein, partial [Toxoplasma gondii RUB]